MAAVHLRRFVALYLTSAIAGAQVLFVLEGVLGLALPLGPSGPMLTVGFPLLGTALLWRTEVLRDSEQLRRPLRWLLIGFALFAVWAGGYFLIAAVVDSSRLIRFSGTLEASLPFWPDASLIYVCVQPLFLLPFAALPDESSLERYAGAAVLVLVVSFVVWSAFPVEMPRPVLPESLPDAPGFGEYALRTIYAADRAVNCLPSTHCAMALLSAMALHRSHPVLSSWGWLTAVLIGAATILTRQHYVVDVLTGYGLGAVAFLAASRFRRLRPRSP